MWKLIVLLFVLLFSGMTVQAQSPIRKHRWQQRVLLVFDEDYTDRFNTQMAAFTADRSGMEERKLVVYEIIGEQGLKPDGSYLEEEEIRLLRKRFGVSLDAFLVVLVGLDGTEKFRSSRPADHQEIFRLIDSMPMRQAEMEGQQPHDP